MKPWERAENSLLIQPPPLFSLSPMIQILMESLGNIGDARFVQLLTDLIAP